MERCGVGRQLFPQAVDHGAFGGLDRGGIVAAAGRCAEEKEEEGTDRDGVGGHSSSYLLIEFGLDIETQRATMG